MPLPSPTLDNRRYDQLVSEARALIPRLAPRLTDHNASDPAITLIELGAWLAEQNIYRFDRLSDEALRMFVRLAGVEPAMPQVATTVVAIANDNANGVLLPPRLQLATSDGPAFETTAPLFASPAKLVRILHGRGTLADATQANADGSGFTAFGSRPRPGHALYLGFDRALDAAGETLSLHVWTQRWRDDAATRAALIAEDERLVARNPKHCPAPLDWRRHYRVRVVWEYFTTGGKWQPLQEVVDETRALSLSGFVRFKAPPDQGAGGPAAEFFVRCRILRGRFECPIKLARIAFNAVPSEHAVSVGEREIATSRGHAGVILSLGRAPVVAGSVRLRLDNGAGDVQTDWREVPDFERAGPHDAVVMLNPERGELHSGNGLRARMLPAGYRVSASFRVGGGKLGDIAAGRLIRVPATQENVALVPTLPTLGSALLPIQSFAATGGAPRETLVSAQRRAYEVVNEVDKAVTLADLERLALETPAVPVARVRAVANMAPALPCYPAPGVITLIVIPACPQPTPMPSRALLDAVERYLEPRRLVTSEIHAIAPRYRRVAVSATLHLACDANASDVLPSANARLQAFFDPLDGGPDGTGWPFGRTVYRSEVMALLAGTPGVARVTALSLRAACRGQSGDCGDGHAAGRCDNVELCPHELVRSGRHYLTLESVVTHSLTRSDAHECGSA